MITENFSREVASDVANKSAALSQMFFHITSPDVLDSIMANAVQSVNDQCDVVTVLIDK